MSLQPPPCHSPIPDDAFIGPLRLEGSVVVETAIDNPALVDQIDLLAAWEELSAVSVEAAVVGRPDIFDFANNHCLLFAAVRSPIRIVLTPSTELAELGLPASSDLVWTDSPILPADPATFYSNVDRVREQLLRRSQPQPSCEIEGVTSFLPSPTTTASPADRGHLPDPTTSQDALFQWKTIGVIYVTMSPIPREVHVGLALLPTYRGKGRGMPAAAFAVQWAVETIQAHRVQARIMSSALGNDRAQRLFTALGFVHEGLQRRVVTDAAGSWVDVTHMGIIDVDWVVRKRQRAAPRSMWDEMFERHQREREELLRWEERLDGVQLRRTESMETIRVADVECELETLSQSDAPSSRSLSPATSLSSSTSSGSRLGQRPSYRSPQVYPDSDAGDPFSDSEWVSGNLSDGSRSSEASMSRPQSAASWSSYESLGSAVTSSEGDGWEPL